MSQSAATWHPSKPPLLSAERLVPLALTLGLGTLIVTAVIVMNGAVGWALAPLILAGTLWLVVAAPVRTTFFILVFLSLSTDRPGDSSGLWESPFVNIGGLLSYNMSNILGIEALKISGISLTLLLLIAVRVHRSFMGRVADTPGAIAPAPPMNWALLVGLVTVLWLIIWGAINGGDTQMAKVQTQVYLPMLATAFVLGASLRGARDIRAYSYVIIAAASCKAAMALWARRVLPEAIPDAYGVMREVEYATNHGDSLLFTCACLVLLVPIFFTPSWRTARAALVFLPLIIAGMIANDRRLVWVELAMGLALLPMLSPQVQVARYIRKLLLLLSPVILLYIGVGWFSASKIFGPVKLVRSVVSSKRSDGSVDLSTLFRDVENFNLIYTFQSSPFVGRGFGHPFQTAVQNADLSGFKEYPYLPHNSLLGLMAFTGGFGVLGLFTPFVVGFFFLVRSQYFAQSPDQAVAAAVAIGNLCAYLMHVWGDIGFTEPTAIFTAGVSLALAGQLAVATGAWRRQRPFDLPWSPHVDRP